MRIEIDALSVRYPGGVHALNDVRLRVDGGMVGLLGPNGAGKTTLMRVLTGVLRPTTGRVVLGGEDLSTRAGRSAVRHLVGYLPQHLELYPDLTGRELLDYVGLLKGLDDRPRRTAQVGELLELVGLEQHGDRRVSRYSGGMQRRLGIAQALLGDPELVVVDEPTAGLDPEERMRFRSLLAGIGVDRTVLLSTHILDDVAQACPSVAVLAGGRVVFDGPTDGLTARADGRTYVVSSPVVPDEDVAVANAVHTAEGTEYRIVSGRPPEHARAVRPTLEDGYVAMLQQARA